MHQRKQVAKTADSNGRHHSKRKQRRPRHSSITTIGKHTVWLCSILFIFTMTVLLYGLSTSHSDDQPIDGKRRLRGNKAGTAVEETETSENRRYKRFTEEAPFCDAIAPDDVSFTLVTQCSLDRLWMMEHHCERWGTLAPISLVVFTDLHATNITQQLIDLGCGSQEQLTVQTLSTKGYAKEDYPVNVLRNMALSQVRTSHVMYADVDFWESEDLFEILNLSHVREQLARDPKLAAVVPAFQIARQCPEYRDCRENNVAKMPRTLQDMAEMILERKGSAFDPTNPGGHGSTSYAGWFHQAPGEFLDIECVKSNRYEPYMAFRYCRDLPPYQVQFSGYGKNKMTMVMQMRRSGYLFSQLGGAFVVHYPHLDSVSRMEWNKGPEDLIPKKNSEGKWVQKRPKDLGETEWTAYKRGRVDETFKEFRKWLLDTIPDQSRVPKCNSSVGQDDDAKLWIDHRFQIKF